MDDKYDYRLVLGPHTSLSPPLQRLLARNAEMLRQVNAEFPGVKKHRDVLSGFLERPLNQMDSAKTHQSYVDTIRAQHDTRRIIYNYDAFIGSRANALSNGYFYPSLEAKLGPFRQLTHGHTVTIFLCLTHFANFVVTELKNSKQFREWVSGYPAAFDFSWIEFIERIQRVWPEAGIVLLNADKLAENWPLTVSLITGHENPQQFRGIENFPASRLTEAGHINYLKSLKESPPETAVDLAQRTSKFFAEYDSYDEILSKVITSPWSEDQLEHSKHTFDADILSIATMRNVELSHDLDWDVT